LLILADSYQVLQHLNRFASVIEKRMFWQVQNWWIILKYTILMLTIILKT
jgi:hypothetical protein